jgi:hypothetical protein
MLIVRIGVGVAAIDQADVVARRSLGDGVQCGGRLGHELSVECRSYVLSRKCGKSYGAGQQAAAAAQFALPTRQHARSRQRRPIAFL